MIELKGKNQNAKIMIDNVDTPSINMIQNILNHPACTNQVRIMPDVHLGKGIVLHHMGQEEPFQERKRRRIFQWRSSRKI